MDFDEITKILEMMRQHELSEFELERDNFKLRIRKHAAGHWVAAAPYAGVPAAPAMPPPSAAMAAASAAASAAAAAAEEELEFAVVKSPIVGTFYRAVEPGAKPFADVGDVVKTGQVLCIIEAMKLMNEINAEVDGEIVKVYVENGHAVQYGERLFAIRPNV
ncbi:MAG: acetyl-CoA carboxylase, biotin carboxyl carrier protein [Acidobacteria bacterium RIFCSPLOWO2_02_FULL_67_21]|nr:MAG: acetyl-CoA carboxylase, biotin carboxyl carrier protein [Acidobacteria bacterium RIFCSPLOWO2_02_FULL_67_21]